MNVQLSYGRVNVNVSAPVFTAQSLSEEFHSISSCDNHRASIQVLYADKSHSFTPKSDLPTIPLTLVAPQLSGWLQCIDYDGTSTVSAYIRGECWPRPPSEYPVLGRPRKRLGAFLRRFRQSRYLNDQELFQLRLIVQVIEPLVCLQGPNLGIALLHSSAIDLDGYCTLFAGTGGVGKSTAILQLMRRYPGFRFLSDDWTIVAGNGSAFHYPRHVNIYAYNTAGFPSIEDDIFQNRSWLDRYHWKLTLRKRGANSTARRVSPKALFGESSHTQESKVRRIYFLDRREIPSITACPMSVSSFARKMRHVLLSERATFFGALARWHAICDTLPLPTPELLLDQSEQIYREFASNSEIIHVTVPTCTDAKALATYLVNDRVCGVMPETRLQTPASSA